MATFIIYGFCFVVSILLKVFDRRIYKSSQSGLSNWVPPGDHKGSLERLGAVDPSFDWESFRSRIESAFLQIQSAWQKQALTPVMPFISDSIAERFTLQIGEQIREGYRDHMPQIDVQTDRMQMAAARITEHFETVDIQITCSAIDYRVSLETGQPIDGESTAPDTFTEYWSFIRRRGVTSTPHDQGLFEGHCPNCGTSLEMSRLGTCSSCDAVLRNGEHDWVLAEITQASVWRPGQSANSAASMARYRSTRDPGFTVQHIEDRASVIFWRRTLAERDARVDPIRKMALDSFCDEYQAELSNAQAKGGREFWHDCSVGSVDCRGVLSDSEADFALVLVRWSGNLHQALKNGSLEDLDRWTRINTLMVLRRQTGVASNLDRTVTSAHCPSCGAPESDVASHACEFCNEVINDGRFDWVLDQWLPIHSAQALKWLERLNLADAATDTTTPTVHDASVANALDWAVQTVVADGVISDEENRAILQLAARQGLTSHQAQSLVNQAVKQELDPPVPTSGKQGRQWLTMVADVAVADGTVDDAEMNVLLDLGHHVGMARYDVKLLLAKSQARQRREGT